jgi:hypothetical protein
LSFAWLSVLSIPESYSLTVLSGVICMLSGSSFAHATQLDPKAAFRHAVITGVGAWIYHPICGAVLLILPALRVRREWLTVLLPCVAIAVLIGNLPNVMAQTVTDQIAFVGKWSSVENFLNLQLILSVIVAFLFFGLVSPVNDFLYARSELHLAQVFSHWHTAGAVIFLGICFVFLLRHADWRRMSGIVMWFLCMIAFHVFFNPREVLLYAALPVTLLCYMVGLALSSVLRRDESEGAGRGTKAGWGLAGVLMIMVLLNIRSVIGV